MKRLFLSLVVALMFVGMLSAQTPDGLTCETAIPVDNSFVGEIEQAGTYYYRVSTYSLPMTCYFYPEATINIPPVVYVDFTCTPGYYDDPNLEAIIKAADGWGLEVPVKFILNSSVDEYNRFVYSLSIDASYRELMAMFNVTYDVEAIVQVNAPCAGKVQMTPDTTFRSCAEKSEWITLPMEIPTGVMHESDSYVLPMVDWQNDSIRFRWTGTDAPVTVWIGEDCEFELKTSGDNCALDMFVLNPDAGNGENIRNFSKKEIQDYVSLFAKGGVYYLRTVSAEEGQLVIEPKPMSEDMSKAILLEPYKTVQVPANATEQVYYFSTKYKEYSILLSSSVKSDIKAYFSHNVSFEATNTDKSILDTHMFTPTKNGAELYLSEKQMAKLCNAASTEYIFIKFISSKATSITPSLWEVGTCGGSTDEIQYMDSVVLQKRAYSTAWRIDIDQWANQDMMLDWKGNSSLQMFLGDACKGFNVTQTNEHIKLYKSVSVNTDGSREPIILTKEELLAVAQYADADGFLYLFFDNSAKGSLVVKPYVPAPAVPVSAALKLDSTIYIKASEIDTTYHIANNWAETSVELVAATADTTNITAFFATTIDIDFEMKNYIAAYPFTIEKEQSRLQLSAMQISSLLKHAKDEKIYVVFVADRDVQITPIYWNACECARNSLEFAIGGNEYIAARSHDVVYRVNYNYWKDYDVTLHWSGYTTIMAYLATVCDFNMVETNMYVLNSSDVDILANDTMQIGEEVRLKAIDGDMLPEDGFLYFRFSTNSSGILTPTFYPVNPDTAVENVITDQRRRQIVCTPDGKIYIIVGEDRYTILGEKL